MFLIIMMNAKELAVAIADTLHDFTGHRGVYSAKEFDDTLTAKLLRDSIKKTLHDEMEACKDLHYDIFSLLSKSNTEHTMLHAYERHILSSFRKHIITYTSTSNNLAPFTKECLSFFGVKKIHFVVDATGIPEAKYFCDKINTTIYKGLFEKIDAKKAKIHINACVKNEFQNYKLTKNSGLLQYDTISANKETGQISLVQSNIITGILKTSSGVKNLVKAIESQKRMHGTHNLRKNTLQIAQHEIKEHYGLPYEEIDNTIYTRSLYDLKRSGDYMTIEAAYQANKTRSADTMYIYDTQDIMAVLWALVKGVPTVYCKRAKNKTHTFTLYMPINYQSSNNKPVSNTLRSSSIPKTTTNNLTAETEAQIWLELNTKNTRGQTIINKFAKKLGVDANQLSEQLQKSVHPTSKIASAKTKLTNYTIRNSIIQNGGIGLTTLPNAEKMLTTAALLSPNSKDPMRTEFKTINLAQSIASSDSLYDVLMCLHDNGVTYLSFFEYIVYRFITFNRTNSYTPVHSVTMSSYDKTNSMSMLHSRPNSIQ